MACSPRCGGRGGRAVAADATRPEVWIFLRPCPRMPLTAKVSQRLISMGTDDLKKYFEDKIAEIFYEAVFDKKLTEGDKEFLRGCNIEAREAPAEVAGSTAVVPGPAPPGAHGSD
jgi:hypothetical protein